MLMRIENTLEGDDVAMLQFLQDLLLHQLCLEEGLRVLLRNDLDSDDLLAMFVLSFKNYSECADSKQANNAIQGLESALAVACINLNFIDVMNIQLLLNSSLNLLDGLCITFIITFREPKWPV